MKLILALLIFSFSLISYAGGDGHGGGSVTDLIPAAVNVIILFGFLAWKLKGPLAKHFSEKSTDIENQMNSAKIKAEEAQALIKSAESKMANLQGELSSIEESTQKEIADFENSYQKETEERITKLGKDGLARVEAERKAGLNNLNEELVEAIIKDAKELVKGDSGKAKKVTNKLLQNLRS